MWNGSYGTRNPLIIICETGSRVLLDMLNKDGIRTAEIWWYFEGGFGRIGSISDSFVGQEWVYCV